MRSILLRAYIRCRPLLVESGSFPKLFHCKSIHIARFQDVLCIMAQSANDIPTLFYTPFLPQQAVGRADKTASLLPPKLYHKAVGGSNRKE